MKKYRILSLIMVNVVFLVFITQFNVVFADTKNDCLTWKLNSSEEWTEGTDRIKSLNPSGYEFIENKNKTCKFSTNYSININTDEVGTTSSVNSMKDKGSLIYSLMKMVILSGVTKEFDGVDGVNPNIFYWDLALATKEDSFSYSTALSYNNSENYYSEYLTYRYKDIVPETHKVFGTSTSYTTEAKSQEIKEELDNKKYVIVKANDIYVLLTGYRPEDSVTTFLMEDNYSNETIFTKSYTVESITEYQSFSITGNYQSRLDFYNSGGEIPWNLRLINKESGLSEEEISNIETAVATVAKEATTKDSNNSYHRNEMDARVIPDLDKLVTAYNKDTGKTLSCQSGMRSYAYQEILFNNYASVDGVAQAETYSARPGKSEHNGGLAMDFNSEGHGADSSFKSTPGFIWLKKYAFNYGFIWRYPEIEECQEKTGYVTEEWHWRYIGTEWAEKYIEYIGGKIETDANGNKYTEVFDNGDYNGKVYEEFYKEVVVPAFSQNNSDNLSESNNEDENLTIGYCDNEHLDTSIRRLEYFFKHPIKSLSNMTISICQTVHNSLGIGAIGDIFGMSYFVKTLSDSYILKWYMIIATILFFVSIIYKSYLYIWGKVKDLISLGVEIYKITKVIVVPLICFTLIAYGLDFMNDRLLSDWYASLIAIETQGITKITETTKSETETTGEVNVKVNSTGETILENNVDSITIGQSSTKYMTELYLQENIFIEELDETSYTNIEIKMPDKIVNNKLRYYNIDLETLYSTVNAESTIESLSEDNYQYYSCDEFIPVHKDLYSESVFYYFYDYLKYQYLNYYKYQSNKSWVNNYVKAGCKQNLIPMMSHYGLTLDDDLDFKSTEIMTNETLSDYKDRMKFLELNYFNNSLNGYQEMYTNTKYVYTDNYKNYNKISDERYLNDLLGLSYLFSMENTEVDYTQFKALSEWRDAVLNSRTLQSFDDWKTNPTSIPNNPILWFSQGEVFDYYTAKTKISNQITSNDTLMYYNFYPLNINSKFKNYDNTRILNRAYASYGKLLYDCYDSKDFKRISQPTNFEQKLIKINNSTYSLIKGFIEEYPTGISDNTMCFTIALIATIEFNKEFGAVEPDNIDTQFIDMDKILRLTYLNNIDDIKDNEQIFYMMYKNSNAVNILILSLTEILMAIYNGCRLLLLASILIISIWLALSYCFHKAESVDESIKGILLQTLSVYTMNLICIGIIKLNVYLNKGVTEPWLQVLYSAIMFLLFMFVTLVAIVFTVAMLRDMKHYGYGILNGIVQNAKNVYDNTVISLEENINLRVDNADVKKKSKETNKKLSVRKRIIDMLSEDSDDTNFKGGV